MATKHKVPVLWLACRYNWSRKKAQFINWAFFRYLNFVTLYSWVRTPALKLLQKMPTHSFLCLWYFSPAIQVSDGVLTSFPNVLQSQDERPLQKLVTLSIAELIPVFSSGFVLCCDCRTLFKPAPSPEQASASEKTTNSISEFIVFSSSDLALWRACRTLFQKAFFGEEVVE